MMRTERLSTTAQAALELARRIALKETHAFVSPSHLVLALLEPIDSPARQHFDFAGIDLAAFRQTQYRRVAQTKKSTDDEMDTAFHRNVEAALIRAEEHTARNEKRYVGVGELLLGLWDDADIREDLLACGARPDGWDTLQQSVDSGRSTDAKAISQYEALSAYTVDLTQLAEQGKLDSLIGREDEIEQVVQVLSRRLKNNPVVVGEPGTGKTAIVEGLAQRIVDGEVPQSLLGHVVLSLDIGRLLAGAKMRGEFEERIKRVLEETQEARNVLLFIDEIHMMVGAGGQQGGTDAAGLLKPALSRGEVRCIGATTLDEYRKHIEKDSALSRRFQIVLVDEPGRDEAVEILQGLKANYEAFHGVQIEDEAILAAVDLSSRYITDRFLPDKAIDLVDHSAAALRVRLAKEQQADADAEPGEDVETTAAADGTEALFDDDEDENVVEDTVSESAVDGDRENEAVITASHIAASVSKLTGVPVDRLMDSEAERLLQLESVLEGRVVGQSHIVPKVARALRRARTGLQDPHRPLGSFLFLGPTGVGKTELCKAVAEFMFDTERALVRLDMSEYMEKHSVARLVGAPPGYVGYDEGGTLTNHVRRRPYSAILFDEAEKAHPDVFNLLLQVLDEGRLTDGQGKVVDFKNTIIIMTSNLGGGLAGTSSDEQVMEAVRQHFRPEFLNRLDDTLVFQPLGMEQMKPIVELQTKRVGALLQNKNCRLEISDEAAMWLAERGYDPAYGARPLKRVVQAELQDPLAEMVLQGLLPEQSLVRVHCAEDMLDFQVTPLQPDDDEEGREAASDPSPAGAEPTTAQPVPDQLMAPGDTASQPAL